MNLRTEEQTQADHAHLEGQAHDDRVKAILSQLRADRNDSLHGAMHEAATDTEKLRLLHMAGGVDAAMDTLEDLLAGRGE